MTEAGRPHLVLSATELDGVAELWRRERREFVTSFGGTSMLPAIRPGQHVTVSCGVEPGLGDVAVFRYENQIGVHRVVARTANWLVTWGDANPLPDEPIPPARVIGVIRDVAGAQHSPRRVLLLWLLTWPQRSQEVLTQRIRRAYRIRAVWGEGVLAFANAALKALLRRLSLN